ncbi:hypothetical protein [Rubrivirga sp. IMCC43871]|uniref:hypothetical protein n=1 Tax=Rubrivirga sp. IMCC43871 TaxID=3391575 RepID=UPI00399009FF
MRRPAALLALAAALAVPAFAQPVVTPARESPVGATDLVALGSGGAVAAMPTLDSPFLSNPAHITARGFSLTIAGATAGAGGNVRETYDFYDTQLGPAIEEGLDEIRTNDPTRLAVLYNEALRIGAQPKTADLAVLAPSLRFGAGPASVGAGIYGSSVSRGRITNGGGGVPFIDLYSQADVAVPVVVGLDLGKTPAALAMPFGLRVGASATYLQRRVTGKADPVDALDPDGEKIYVLRGDAVRLAVGAFATDVVVPGLDLGAELSNVGGTIDYDFDRSIDVSGSEGTPDDTAEIAALEARFDDRPTEAVARVGAAFRLPAIPGVRASIGVDYTSAATSDFEQSAQAGLRGGARARFGGVFELRAGVSQGMPTAGASIATKFVRLGYATYGVEDGRLLGQLQRRNHAVQIRVGIF